MKRKILILTVNPVLQLDKMLDLKKTDPPYSGTPNKRGYFAVLRIRIRLFLGLLDPDPSIIKQK
jgi:hypothetical protein